MPSSPFPTVGSTGWGAANGSLQSYIDSGSPGLSVSHSGAVGDGSTDDTSAIQSALTSAGALSNGGTVWVPAGTYKITATLNLPANVTLDMATGATFKAGATIAGPMVATPLSTLVSDRLVMRGGILDCNGLAPTGLAVRYFTHITVRDVTVWNFTGTAFKIGDTGAPVKSYEAMLRNLHTWRPSGTTPPTGSRGISFDNASDSVVTGATLVGAETGTYTDFPGHTFTNVHVWGFPGYDPTNAFYDNGGNNTYIGCYSDNALNAGWVFMADGCTVISPLVVKGHGTDNVGSAFVNGQTFAVAATVLGGRVDCNPSFRLANDWSGGPLALVSYTGTSTHNVVATIPQRTAGGSGAPLAVLTSELAQPTNTTTETALLAATIPAKAANVGTTYRVTVGLSVDFVNPSGTLTFRLRWGGVGGASLGSVQVPSVASTGTGQQIFIEFLMTVRATGATGSASMIANMRSQMSGVNAAGGFAASTIDTTTAKDLTVTAQWATAATGNICRIEVGTVELVQV